MSNQDQRALAAAVACRLWRGFTDNEKTGVRHGLMPAEAVRTAQELSDLPHAIRLLSVALMDCARHDRGMRA